MGKLMNSRLTSVSPFAMSDTTPGGGVWSVPNAAVLVNIPVLWTILFRVIEDWLSEASRYSLPLETVPQVDKAIALVNAIEMGKPCYIQCLFSYITSFFALENGYHLVYAQLNETNRRLNLKLRHPRPPKRSALIERLWLVRNFSVAHWAGTEKRNADSIAGRSWDLFIDKDEQKGYNISDLRFGASGVLQRDPVTGVEISSKDRQLGPLPKMHESCTLYLQKFDDVCAEYLAAIKGCLPLSDGRFRYMS
jgi:hypothetical protein